MMQNKNIWRKRPYRFALKSSSLWLLSSRGWITHSPPHIQTQKSFIFLYAIDFVIYLRSPASCFLHLEASSVQSTGFSHQISQDLKKTTVKRLQFLPVVFQEVLFKMKSKDIKIQKSGSPLTLEDIFYSASFTAQNKITVRYKTT